MKKMLTICATTILILAINGLVLAGTIASDPLYKASTDLSIGTWHTIRAGTDYELTGFEITAEFQLNLLYQAGILDADIDNINHYWDPMGWTYNYGDNNEYVLNVSAAGGLTIYKFAGLVETTGGPEIKWTLTAWHQTILAGDIIDNGDGTITFQVLPVGTYRPWVGDPPVNNVEVFDGNLNCEVLGYTFTGTIGDIGNGSLLNVNLTPAPSEVWVDDDFDNNTIGWGTTHFTSIQDGIDAVVGSTVYVAAGTYYETYSSTCALKIDKSITLIGTGLPTVDGGLRDIVVQVTADNVTITGMKFVNSGAGASIGIYLFGVGASYTCDNTTLESCEISNNKIGLFLAGANGATIDGNTFTDNTYRSIVIQQDSDNNIFKSNTITMTDGSASSAIAIGSLSNSNIIGGSLVTDGNSITMATSGGGLLYNIHITPDVGAGNNTIQYNEINGGKRAIQIDGGNSGTTTISNNTIGNVGPSFSGVYLNAGSAVISDNIFTNTVRPIDFWGAINVTISGNTINGSVFDGINCGRASGTVLIIGNEIYNLPLWQFGIHCHGEVDNVVIDNNEIYNSHRGIMIESGSTDATITNNYIHDNGHSAMELHETVLPITGNTLDNNWRGIETWSPIIANYNSLLFHTYGGIILHHPGPNNAECNWWGDASGPSGLIYPGSGTLINDNGNSVDYSPWLITSDLDGSCEGGTPLLVIKSGVRDYLATLLPSSDKKTVKILEKAIKHLEKSLADELWEDNYHLSSKGIKVFEEEKTAVHELMKISDLGVSASIHALVEADRMLAEIAIDEAVNEKDKAKAEGEMDKALDMISDGDYDKAIEHYKQAWHQATKALKNRAKSFANSDVEEGSELVDSAIPEVFGLRENYPNPFNPTTLISYDLPEASQVSMTVYDMMGRQVKSLVQEFQPAGNHSVIWNATNDNGTKMSGGMYFYQIRAGSFQQTHKMILLK